MAEAYKIRTITDATRILSVSMDNLKEETKEKLFKLAENRDPRSYLVRSYGPNAVELYVGRKGEEEKRGIEKEEKIKELPEDLQHCVRTALDEGTEWIRFSPYGKVI